MIRKQRIRCGMFLLIGVLMQFSLIAQEKKPSRLYEMVHAKQQQFLQHSSLDKVQLFRAATSLRSLKQKSIDSVLAKKTLLSIDKKMTATLLRNKAAMVSLQIPVSNKKYELVLLKQELNAVDKTETKLLKQPAGKGAHYRGYINGDTHSIAAFSIFEDSSVVGFFANGEGNFMLAKVKGESQYIVYNDYDLKSKIPFHCYTSDIDTLVNRQHTIREAGVPGTLDSPPLQCRKVKYYWEADYATYQLCGSDYTATENFILATFNQVSAVYQNEGILMELSAYKIWTTPDAYRHDDINNTLLDFARTWNNTNNDFTGDYAFLLCGKYSGGVAYIASSCDRYYSYATAGLLNAEVVSLPTYSWNINVLSHEIGHNLGCMHTQWCGWNTGPNGTCGAIDDCAPVEPAGTCNTCGSTFSNADPDDAWHGTIMSYCHLTQRHILLANGFGPLPGNAIRRFVTYSDCFSEIEECHCGPPASLGWYLQFHGPDYEQAGFYWGARVDAVSYTLQVKKVSDANWTEIGPLTGTTYTYTFDLGINYVARIRSNCSGEVSAFSDEVRFSAPCRAPTVMAIDNISQNSARLTWGSVYGAHSYTVEHMDPLGIWTSVPGLTDTVYTITGLLPGKSYLYHIKSRCTDFMSDNSYNYSFSTVCAVPYFIRAQDMRGTSLVLSWSQGIANPTFTVQYRKVGDAVWLLKSTTSAINKLKIDGLEGGFDYEFMVRMNCSPTFSSEYSYPHVFAMPCLPPPDVYTRNVTKNSASIYWTESNAASNTLQYREAGKTDWEAVTINRPALEVSLPGLLSNTTYEYRLIGNCNLLRSDPYENTFTTLSDPLPLSLGELKGNRNGNNNLLTWSTYQESNTSRFEIEYSTDNTIYQLAGTVPAAGNSATTLSYHFTHKQVYDKTHYRLRMMDADGAFTYSNSIVIDVSTSNNEDGCVLLSGNVYPMPFTDMLNLVIKSCEAQKAKVQLMSDDGRIIRNETFNLKKGKAPYELRGLDNISAGTYLLNIRPGKGASIIQKVVKR